MNFERYLLQQIKMHPSVQPQDLVKLCFQAAYGGEHLLEDLAGAKAYFFQEHAAVEAADIPLYECISDDVCRVNQGAWKYREMPGEWLFEMFADSAGVRGKEGTRAPLRNGVRSDFFSQYLETAGQAAAEGYTSFGPADWESYLAEYRRKGMGAVHHSEIYRKREKPAYRIVDSWYKRLFPILELAVKRRSPGKVCVIAIDGRAASGKSTMAGQLQRILDAAVIRMDDFFLPRELRVPERFALPGGNVHWERFQEEVLPQLSVSGGFSYRRFDCKKMDYDGECMIPDTDFCIVEGSYSTHPAFGNYADITVFSEVEPREQLQRILLRNGSHMAELFKTRWIPLEEAYFEAYRISEKADVRV